MKLSVFVQGRWVAHLFSERDQYVLQYDPGVAPADFVSLTMPVQASPWLWPRDLHPFFRQNLPEGYLLSVLREVLGSALDGTDLSLLAVVGRNGIGRVTVIPPQARDPASEEPLDLKSLLHEDFSPKYFDDLVRRYARSAVSGESVAPGRATLRTARYLVKGSSHLPYLAFNEHHTLRVLARLNKVPVAHTQLSDDGQVLLVERFDTDARGVPTHGLEDACSLLGLPPHEKYAPSLERVLRATEAYLPDATRQTQLERLGYHLLTNFVVRNADCHSKNIALYYTSLDDVAFTPVLDLVTTQAYDGFRDGSPGLSIEGRKTSEVFADARGAMRLGCRSRARADAARRQREALAQHRQEHAPCLGSRHSGCSKSRLEGESGPRHRGGRIFRLRQTGAGSAHGRIPLLAKRRSSPRVRKRKGESSS